MPSDPGTLYRIASITKTFTGTAVMQLRDAGRLTLERPGDIVLVLPPNKQHKYSDLAYQFARRDRDPGERNPVSPVCP
jgi:hypothetical protein